MLTTTDDICVTDRSDHQTSRHTKIWEYRGRYKQRVSATAGHCANRLHREASSSTVRPEMERPSQSKVCRARKTITTNLTLLAALMHTLLRQSPPIATLYVKSAPSTYHIRGVFSFARRMSPCLLVFEDIDTIVTKNTRSYFFNECDGLENNDGILMVASTNHLDQLDAGLSKRPSRFDRKYLFPLPSEVCLNIFSVALCFQLNYLASTREHFTRITGATNFARIKRSSFHPVSLQPLRALPTASRLRICKKPLSQVF